MEDEQPLGKRKPRKISKAFKKLRQKLHSNSSKDHTESRETGKDYSQTQKAYGENQKESSANEREFRESGKDCRENQNDYGKDQEGYSEHQRESRENEKDCSETQKEPSENHKNPSENDKESLKIEEVSDARQLRPLLPSSIAGGPKAVEDEEPAPKPQKDAPPKPLKPDAERVGIETSRDIRHSSEDIKSAKEQDNAKRKIPMQPPLVEAPSITHTSSDGSISYFNSAPIVNRKTEPPFTTPGYEWASRSKGYDWETRRGVYGGNVRLGEHYERTMRQKSEALERTYQKVEAQREQPIKVAATGVRTMIGSGYWAGTEA